MKLINNIIYNLREDKDLRQLDVAKVIGTTQQHYSRCEKGECEFSTRSIVALADFYNVSTDYLLGRTDCKQGIDVLKQSVTKNYTTGHFLSELFSLNEENRRAVIEYMELQKLKEKFEQSKHS
ncbi:helix-turn-helix domain-containing protein [Clostridium minihomine]|uniref:helix-turn-helix domain-containing protein n=1 Tax=Clostridium minihomine TaxID=2045012 RepID=UPI000C75A35D|nr:helix-turn-helix transcriptional regulator [Clostridium minihomine]